MFCELLGKEAGYCRGKGGSMHIADHENGNLGANAIVGGSAGIATGAAFSAKARGTDQVAVCFFGEGALGQGVLYEVMNMASLWKLPVVYVCENNLYNEYTHYSRDDGRRHRRAPGRLRHPRRGGRRPGRAGRAPRRARAPSSGRAPARAPRSSSATPTASTVTTWGTSTAPTTARKEEESAWVDGARPARHPGRVAAWPTAGSSRESLERIEGEIAEEVGAAVAFALEAPYPDPAEVDQHVYP